MRNEDLDQKRLLRTALLKKVYEMTNGHVKFSGVNGGDVATQLGIGDDKVDDLRAAAEYLHGEGLLTVTWVAGRLPGYIQLTHLGLKEFEAALTSPDKPTKHLSPINILVIENAIGSNIQQGTTASSQTMTIGSDSIEAIKSFLTTLTQSIPKLSLNENDETELKADVKTIRVHVESPNPKPIVIRELLVSIRSILEMTTSNVIAIELARKIQPLLHMLGF